LLSRCGHIELTLDRGKRDIGDTRVEEDDACAEDGCHQHAPLHGGIDGSHGCFGHLRFALLDCLQA
jgi:hypothetical protein